MNEAFFNITSLPKLDYNILKTILSNQENNAAIDLYEEGETNVISITDATELTHETPIQFSVSTPAFIQIGCSDVMLNIFKQDEQLFKKKYNLM